MLWRCWSTQWTGHEQGRAADARGGLRREVLLELEKVFVDAVVSRVPGAGGREGARGDMRARTNRRRVPSRNA